MSRGWQLLQATAVAVLSSVAFATPGAWSQEAGSLPALRQGAMALQFGVRDDFALTSFHGGVLSLKYHTSDRGALRLAFGVRLSEYDIKNSDSYWDTAFTTERGVRGVDVRLQYLRYSARDSRLVPFWALGPAVGYEFLREDDGTPASIRSIRAGLIGNVGAEWLVGRAIGLHAEYGLALEYNERELVEEQQYSHAVEEEGWDVIADRVLLGISLYF